MLAAAALLLPTLLTAGNPPPADAVKLNPPRVQYRTNIASATAHPWIDANGWRILLSPDKTFLYDVQGETAALAAAEAFTYGAAAFISADEPGAGAFSRMVETLRAIPPANFAAAADFGVVEDHSPAGGELLNLLTRLNLLYRIEKAPARKFHINVQLGSADYPLTESANPSTLAHRIRSQLGDDNRSLRIYGSEVVIGRLLTGPRGARVYLLNYSNRPVLGLRVRVHGRYAGGGQLRSEGLPGQQLADWTQDGPAAEFTVPELHSFAAVDLSRN